MLIFILNFANVLYSEFIVNSADFYTKTALQKNAFMV